VDGDAVCDEKKASTDGARSKVSKRMKGRGRKGRVSCEAGILKSDGAKWREGQLRRC
jgi:hypothetical protein